MRLLLDIGNTKTTAYIENGKNNFESLLLDTLKNNTITEQIDQVLNKYQVTSCFISSVVPEVNENIVEYLEHLNIQTKLLTVDDYQTLINVGDLDYTSMGADRVVVDYAAIEKYGKDIIVFDLGTAVTVDVIKNEEYQTGYIFPGLRLIRDSLTAGASQLKTFDFFELSEENTAVNTLSQLNDGILYGLLGVINQYIKVGKKHFSTSPAIILTGGSMYNILKLISEQQLSEILEAQIIVDLDLMAEGLKKISEKL